MNAINDPLNLDESDDDELDEENNEIEFVFNVFFFFFCFNSAWLKHSIHY